MDGCEEKERKYVLDEYNYKSYNFLHMTWTSSKLDSYIHSCHMYCFSDYNYIILPLSKFTLTHMSRYHFLLKALSLIKKKPNKLNQFFASNVRCWVSQLQLISEFRRSLMVCVICPTKACCIITKRLMENFWCSIWNTSV